MPVTSLTSPALQARQLVELEEELGAVTRADAIAEVRARTAQLAEDGDDRTFRVNGWTGQMTGSQYHSLVLAELTAMANANPQPTRPIEVIRWDLLAAYAEQPRTDASRARVTALLREMVDAALALLASIGVHSPLTVYRDGLMAGIITPDAAEDPAGLPEEIRQDLLSECQRRRGDQIAAELRTEHAARTAAHGRRR